MHEGVCKDVLGMIGSYSIVCDSDQCVRPLLCAMLHLVCRPRKPRTGVCLVFAYGNAIHEKVRASSEPNDSTNGNAECSGAAGD
jgi:hypothetical protein